ncbi:MAG: TonB family protein [Elusimicrobiales bacterium]|nr:TonB family protein [Elusimicrobiales bacterium]
MSNHIIYSTIIHIIIMMLVYTMEIKNETNNKKYYIDFLSSQTQIISPNFNNLENNEKEKKINEKVLETKEIKKNQYNKNETLKAEVNKKQIEDPDYLYKNINLTPSMAKEKSSIIEETVSKVNNSISENHSNSNQLIRTDTDFPYPWYITKLRGKLWDSWQSQNIISPSNIVVVKFKIYQNGEIKDIKIEKSSGNKLFDHSAISAVSSIKRVDPLPTDFEEDHLIVYVEFKSIE